MVALVTQKDFRTARNLAFCYLCGSAFGVGDNKNYDHIPPENAFDKKDRMPLKLPTHCGCNHAHHLTDEKIGQMIGLRRGQVPSPKNRKLKVTLDIRAGLSLLTNLDIEDAIWRWIRGFHAALYQQHLPADNPSKANRTGALQTPFQAIMKTPQGRILKSILPQHQLFVRIIKENRARKNLDRIECNSGKLIYECVWRHTDKTKEWLCIFALNICGWKDLGSVPGLPHRGCAGYYRLPSGEMPEAATRVVSAAVHIPNFEPLDPFGR